MKKILSGMLATVMTAGVFAMNAGAAIPTSYEKLEGYVPERVLYLQDFSDIEKNADYTDRNYDGIREVREDGVLHMFGSYRTGVTSDTYATTPITESKFVYEFDFMRNDDFSTDVQLFVTFQKAANADSENLNLKRYGVIIPVRTVGMVTVDGVNYEDNINPEVDIEPHKWYKFRLTIDEDAFVAAGGTEDNGPLKALMKVERKAEDETEWTALKHSTFSHFKSGECRIYGASATTHKGTNEVIFGIKSDQYGESCEVYGYTWDEETQTYVKGETVIQYDDFTKADFQVDNIKMYVPGEEGKVVTKDYPVNKGVVFTDFVGRDITMVGKEPEIKDETGNVIGKGDLAPATIYDKRKINWAYEPTAFVAIFDAMNEVVGGPFSIAFAGLNANSKMMTIAPTETGKWYSYKALYTCDGVNTDVTALYRKAADETEWTLLEKGADAEWWNGYNSSGSKNEIRFYLYGGLTGGNAASNCELGTKWNLKNIQITDNYAMTGTATVDGDELTIALNTVVADAAAMVAAVYDGDRMVSSKAVDVAALADEAEIVVPYDSSIENPAVKIFILDGMGTMIPMDIPVDITAAID